MSYANVPIQGIWTRVPSIVGVPSSTRTGGRAEHEAPTGGHANSARQAGESVPTAAPALSSSALRAQAVTGLLEARRDDVTRVERAVAEPGRDATRTLADVWPREDKAARRPDARVAADLDLLQGVTSSRTAQEARERALRTAEKAAVVRDAITQEAADAQARALFDAHTMSAAASHVARTSDRTAADVRDDDPNLDPHDDAHAQQPVPVHERARRVADALAAVGRLASTVARLTDDAAARLARALAETNDMARRVADLNGLIQSSVRDRGVAPPEAIRQRDQLVGALSRSVGATAQPGAGSVIDLRVDGRVLVSGAGMRPLVVEASPGTRAVVTAGGASVNVSAGTVAGHRDTINGMLPALADSVSAVLDRLVAQASDAAGPPVDGGPRAADLLDGVLAHVARSAESSSAYAQIAAGVEDLLHRLSVGDVPSAVRASDLLLGAITGPEPTVALPALEDTLSPLRVALAGLGRAAADVGAPGGATATRSVISGAPSLVTVLAAPEAPAGAAKVRVLSVAASGTAVTAQTFAPDEALGDGTERTIGLVRHLGTSDEHTTVIDVGRYPTITDLAQSINQANVDVRATVAPIGAGVVQLHITSLSSGRSSSVTIVNGEDPPTTSTILGRVVPLVSGRDTLLELQRPGETAALVQSTGRLVRGVLPGVDVEVRAADPGRTFQVGLQWLSAPTLDRATDLVARAAAVVSSAQVAGASATASRVLSALGLASAETAGGAGTLEPAGAALEDGVDGRRTPLGFPGVRRDERGLPHVNRSELAAAFDRDARGTQAQLSVSARALAGVAANADGATWEAYAFARAAQGPDRFALYSPPQTQQTRDGEQVSHTLTRREEALRAVLGRLQDQGEWLGAQLPVRDGPTGG